MSALTGAARTNHTRSIATRVVDAARHAADLSHEARAIAARAEEAVEDGVDAARRTARSVRRNIEKLEDESVYYVRRHPLQTVALAAGIGVCAGVATGWIAARLCSQSPERGPDRLDVRQ